VNGSSSHRGRVLIQRYIKECVRNNFIWERGRLACIFIAGGTPALPDRTKWASYLGPIPKFDEIVQRVIMGLEKAGIRVA